MERYVVVIVTFRLPPYMELSLSSYCAHTILSNILPTVQPHPLGWVPGSHPTNPDVYQQHWCWCGHPMHHSAVLTIHLQESLWWAVPQPQSRLLMTCCMHIHTYTHTHTQHVHMHTCTHAQQYACTHSYTRTHTRTHTCTYTTCTHIHTHAHTTCTHAWQHVCTHTHTHITHTFRWAHDDS